MEELVLLTHRIPYPPNKGDKIRSYHLLRFLAQRYRVHLGTFIDDPDDWQHVPRVQALCAETCFLALTKSAAMLRGMAGFLTGAPLTLPYYYSHKLEQWLEQQIAGGRIRGAIVFSSSMAQYLEPYPQLPRIADLVDVDSDKWSQYAAKSSVPKRWLYRREARTLLSYERKVAESFDTTFLVSEAEAALLRKLAPRAQGRIQYFNNGVDADYFSPAGPYASPFADREAAIVFTGAMDYWPNIDAVSWFANEVFPEVRRTCPSAQFYIVGSRPAPAVLDLGRQPGVHVTGTVPDVRPYLAHAALVVAPLRIARGIQNKVLEAMAMGQTVLVSPAALEGIDARPGTDLILADGAPAFARCAVQALSSPDPRMGTAARSRVLSGYSWEASLAPVEAALAGAAASAAAAPRFAPSEAVPATIGRAA